MMGKPILIGIELPPSACLNPFIKKKVLVRVRLVHTLNRLSVKKQ